jgi:hypothetical protein
MNSPEIPSTEPISTTNEQPKRLILADIPPVDLETTASILEKSIEDKIYGKNNPDGLPSQLREAGFSDEESTRIMSCSSENEIVEVLSDMQKNEHQALELELNNESLQKKSLWVCNP